ncbi:hypothetical protein K449DRAFT_421900 [Hypoxylon sp. EC38]|nr:hypothetical protein K449DRAFT_421900 [Hypoxylon sp. EC38]
MVLRRLVVLETKYTVYSSGSGTHSPDDSFVLPANTFIDKFVSCLETKSIVLKSKPTPDSDTPFDGSDKLAEWFSRLDKAGTFSLLLDPTLPEKEKALQEFTLKFTAPWGLAFSSSAEALKSTFGEQGSTIEIPGVDEQLKLYCGLLPPDSDIKSTVKDAFEYVGLSEVVEDLPSTLGGLTITLAAKEIAGNRNTMWFEPAYSLQTIIRLQFKLDNQSDLEEIFHDTIPGFAITDATVVAKKIFTQGITAGGPIGVDKGSVVFVADCTISNKGEETQTKMKAGIEFSGSSITLRLKMSKPDALQAILTWLGDLVVIGLSTDEDKNKPTLESFRIDTEVAGNFGQVNNKKPVFLASFVWSAGPYGGMGSTIRAQLWNSFTTSPCRTLSPYYEAYQDLQPFTPNPGTSISLETLIPGQTIEIPDRVPSAINRGYLVLTNTGVSIGATIETVEGVPPGNVPQPYLGQVRLDASYAWGKESEFDFKLGIQTGIQPSESSTHQLPALLEGEISYRRVS